MRGPSAERRSFIAEHAGDLWVGDALHGPLVIGPDGKLRKSYLLSQIDNATRFILHSYFALSESAAPRSTGSSRPSSSTACRAPTTSTAARPTSPTRCATSAPSSVFACSTPASRTPRPRASSRDGTGPGARRSRTSCPSAPVTLAELNAKHWAWLGVEYHARVHDTTQRVPREHLLAEAAELRALPRGLSLDEVFLHRDERIVRKDGTVRWHGGFLEVRPELCGKRVELRFDPTDETALPRVFVDGRFDCDTVPLDRLKNMTRHRRRLTGEPAPDATPSGLDPLALIEDEHYRRTRLVSAAIDNDDDDE